MPKLAKSPEQPTLDDYHSQVSSLRLEMLTSDIITILPPRSEQNFLKALAYLDLAGAELKLADYHRMGNQ